MANRLQLRHNSIIYNSVGEIINFLNSTDKTILFGEPVVFRYKNGNDINVVLVIGSSNNESKYTLFDSATVENDIIKLKDAYDISDKEIKDIVSIISEIKERLNKEKLTFKDSDTIEWDEFVKPCNEGILLTPNVKLSKDNKYLVKTDDGLAVTGVTEYVDDVLKEVERGLKDADKELDRRITELKRNAIIADNHLRSDLEKVSGKTESFDEFKIQTEYDIKYLRKDVDKNTYDIDTINKNVDTEKGLASYLEVQKIKNILPKKLETEDIDFKYDSNKITLYVKGVEIGSIDTTDFVKDKMIKDVVLNGNILVISWNADADDKVTEIDLSRFIDTYIVSEDSTNYLSIKDREVSAIVDKKDGLASYNKLNKLNDDFIELSGITSSNTIAIDSLIDDFSNYKNEVENKFEDVNNNISGLTESVNTINTDISGITENLNNLSIDVENNSANITELSNNLSTLTDTVGAIELNISGLTDSVNVLDGNFNEFKDIVDNNFNKVADSISGLTERVDTIDSEISDITNNLSALTNNVESNYDELIGRISGVTDSLNSTIKTNCDALGKEIGKLNKKLNEEVSGLTENISSLSGDISELENKITVLESNVENAIDELETEIDDSKKLNTTIDENITIPNAIGGFPEGTKVGDVKGMDISMVIQQLLFPKLFPSKPILPSIKEITGFSVQPSGNIFTIGDTIKISNASITPIDGKFVSTYALEQPLPEYNKASKIKVTSTFDGYYDVNTEYDDVLPEKSVTLSNVGYFTASIQGGLEYSRPSNKPLDSYGQETTLTGSTDEVGLAVWDEGKTTSNKNVSLYSVYPIYTNIVNKTLSDDVNNRLALFKENSFIISVPSESEVGKHFKFIFPSTNTLKSVEIKDLSGAWVKNNGDYIVDDEIKTVNINGIDVNYKTFETTGDILLGNVEYRFAFNKNMYTI